MGNGKRAQERTEGKQQAGSLLRASAPFFSLKGVLVCACLCVYVHECVCMFVYVGWAVRQPEARVAR